MSVRFSLFCCVLIPFTLAGCVTQRQKNLQGDRAESALWHTNGSGFSWPFGRAEKLQNPEKMRLADAKWQEQQRHYPKAEEAYQRVLKVNPNSVDAILGIARINALSGNNQKADEAYEKALTLKPNDPYILDTVAQYHGSKQRWPEAVRLLKASTAAGPTIKTHRFHLAVAMANAGNIQGAMPHFTQTVGQAEAHYNVGYILSTQGKLELAKQHLRMAVTQAPQLTQARTLLSQLDPTSSNAQAIARSSLPPAQQARMANSAFASSADARVIRQTGRSTASPTAPNIRPKIKMQVIPIRRQQYETGFGTRSIKRLSTNPTAQPMTSPTMGHGDSATMSPEQLEQSKNQSALFESTTPNPSSL